MLETSDADSVTTTITSFFCWSWCFGGGGRLKEDLKPRCS